MNACSDCQTFCNQIHDATKFKFDHASLNLNSYLQWCTRSVVYAIDGAFSVIQFVNVYHQMACVHAY